MKWYWRSLGVFAMLILAACAGDESANTTAVSPTTTTSNATLVTPAPTTTTTIDPASAPTLLPLNDPVDLPAYSWSQTISEAPWGGRAGLRVVELDGSLLLLGGRTPRQSTTPGDSDIWSDVWRSDDLGASWELILANGEKESWPARAYFQAVVKDGTVFVVGGQDFGLIPNPYCELLAQGEEPPAFLNIDPDAPCPEFLPTSNFYNDVWSSRDGVSWTQLTNRAPWSERAGLSAVVAGDFIYVLGGSKNDDRSIIGPNGPVRIYYNDVWRSSDGADWELMTENAPWEPRAGASVVEHGGEIWLLGGEDGFTCEPLPDCDPPYFNDVWRSVDGAEWTLVSSGAAWSKRPGHQCEELGADLVCFGGFGLIENPTDMWSSSDGIEWTRLSDAPWNAATPQEVKYDFDSITILVDGHPAILTVGGDRETFDFADPENYLRVDSDVWQFAQAD